MRTQFVFANLPRATDVFSIDDGPEVAHIVELNMANFYACNEMVFLYDTAETPSGITFNLDPSGNVFKQYTKVDVFNPPPPLES